MRRALSFLAFLALPVAVACGRQLSETAVCTDAPPANLCPEACSGSQPVCNAGVWTCQGAGDIPGCRPPDAGDDSGEDAGEDSGGCIGATPTLYCNQGCGQYGWYTAWCAGGTWECPEFGVPACDLDAGAPDACAYPSGVSCGGSGTCGLFPYPTCSDGVWSCTDPCSDAGPPPDANAPSFSCGDLACDPSTSFCLIDTGGALQPDGGVSSGYSCVPLPSACNGQSASCDCVNAYGELSTCGCVAEGQDVIVTCAVP